MVVGSYTGNVEYKKERAERPERRGWTGAGKYVSGKRVQQLRKWVSERTDV